MAVATTAQRIRGLWNCCQIASGGAKARYKYTSVSDKKNESILSSSLSESARESERQVERPRARARGRGKGGGKTRDKESRRRSQSEEDVRAKQSKHTFNGALVRVEAALIAR